jgi:hypothetical protein
MDRSSEGAVERQILGDLRPVRPLARPWKRALGVCGVGALLACGVYLGFGVRHDARLLGRGVLWGLSGLQAAYGVILIVSALRVSIPGRTLARQFAAGLLLAGVGLVLTITYATWLAHASLVPIGRQYLYWSICFRTPVLLGLPPLLLTLLLAFRAYPTRPALTGALAGLGAGLLSDGSWRTYCEVSDPGHVLTSHVASVVLLTAGGLLLALLFARRRERGRDLSKWGRE